MTGFSADWLTLREPFDMRARNPSVLDAVAHYLATYPSVRIVDLACGTGSTLRALSARIPSRQNWNLVDNDLSLLARATATEHRDNVVVSGIPLDLNRDLEAALDGPVDLVTTSALLDLVSESWLERLTVEIAARAIPFYAALSYDGRAAFTPPDPFDTAVVGAVNLHQRTNKGFGAALGPAAAEVAPARFAALDCARVKEMQQQGSSPADIARTLGITTPDVQACLAGVVEEPEMARPKSNIPLAPQRPIGDGPIRRAPDGQNE